MSHIVHRHNNTLRASLAFLVMAGLIVLVGIPIMVAEIMIGRAAMANPWVFQGARHYLKTGTHAVPATVEQRFALMRRHCEMAIARSTHGGEFEIIRSLRSRLMS